MTSHKYTINQIEKEPRNQEIWSRRAYVDWVNETLAANFTNTLEFRNGAAYLQLIDMLFPGTMPVEDVRFCAETQYDCYKNFRILEQLFKKLGINKVFNTDALSSGRHVESWAFLKWFKTFFDHNYKKKDYDPLKARNFAYMGFGKKTGNEKILKPAESPKGHCKLLCKKLGPVRSKSAVGFEGIDDDEAPMQIKGKTLFPKKSCRSAECLIEKKKPAPTLRTNSPVFEPKTCEKESCNELLENEKEPSFKDLELISLETFPVIEKNTKIETINETKVQVTKEIKEENRNFPIEISNNLTLGLINDNEKTEAYPKKANTVMNLELMPRNERSIKNRIENTTGVTSILGRALILRTEERPEGSTEVKTESKNNPIPKGKNNIESNVKSIVVNTTQEYEECGVRVTENLQLKIESADEEHESPNENTTQERQKKINLMIEKLLRYHWTERKEYFQTIADFLKEEKKKAQR